MCGRPAFSLTLVLFQAASVYSVGETVLDSHVPAGDFLRWKPKDPDSGDQVQWAEDMVNSEPITSHQQLQVVASSPRKMKRQQQLLRVKSTVSHKQADEFEPPSELGHFLGLKPKLSQHYSVHWAPNLGKKKLALSTATTENDDNQYMQELYGTRKQSVDRSLPEMPRQSRAHEVLQDSDVAVGFPPINWGTDSRAKPKPANHKASAVQENAYLASVGWQEMESSRPAQDNPYLEALQPPKFPKVPEQSHDAHTYTDDLISSKDWIMLHGPAM